MSTYKSSLVTIMSSDQYSVTDSLFLCKIGNIIGILRLRDNSNIDNVKLQRLEWSANLKSGITRIASCYNYNNTGYIQKLPIQRNVTIVRLPTNFQRFITFLVFLPCKCYHTATYLFLIYGCCRTLKTKKYVRMVHALIWGGNCQSKVQCT